jgi:hypothetical protein
VDSDRVGVALAFLDAYLVIEGNTLVRFARVGVHHKHGGKMKRDSLRKSICVLSSLVLLLSVSFAASAQRGNRDEGRRRDDGRWERLGDARVDGRQDHDTIRVNARGRFRAIRFFIQGGEIEFQRVVVHFDNGADTDVEVRERIRRDGTTRSIDLPGDERRIRSVEVWYGKGSWGGSRPQLVLYGRR